MGLVPALEALAHTLAQYALMAELVRELGKLIIALKEGKPLPEVLGAVASLGRSAVCRTSLLRSTYHMLPAGDDLSPGVGGSSSRGEFHPRLSTARPGMAAT